MRISFDISKIKQNYWFESILWFWFSFAIIFGPTYALFDSFDYNFETTQDLKTYLGIANFDFDQSPIRKYRVIIPFIASGFDFCFGWLFEAIGPNSFPGPDFSMCFSFLIVNSTIMSLFGVVVFQLARAYGASRIASVVGLLSVLTCRWTFYIAGIPLVDSLYVLVAALTLLAIKTQNHKLTMLVIFLGPWAKESFIFIAPLIFFFSDIKKWKQVLYFGISGALVFSFRYLYDYYTGTVSDLGLTHDFNHVDYIPISLKRLFSFHGAYELFSIFGLWGMLYIFVLQKEIRDVLKSKTELFIYLYLVIIVIHAIFSSELARMFYLATPVSAVWIALVLSKLFLKPSFIK